MAEGVKGPLIAGLFAVAGALGGAAVTGWSQVQLAKQKFNSDLVLKALESAEPEQRLESLRLLVETNLLQDPEIQSGVREYAKARESRPETIPQVVPSQAPTLSAPVVADARIFLLAGTEQKRTLFTSYKADLEGAGYRVLDSKVLNDEGRPMEPEVRYFHAQDARQAEAIAEFVRFKLADKSLMAKLYQDARARPGYIEVWFGK
jgi:hypothetical protein